MKLLVGVMYCIENEFVECVASIKEQTFQDMEIFTVEKLPNKEAHDKLYNTFMDNAAHFDFFIKIDADMVLARPTLFEEVIQKMQAQPDVDNLQIAVHDFFTDRLIYGLNIFRSSVRWNTSTHERIFVDRIEIIRKRINDKVDLAPAAYHCPNPSDFQAFHFGIHKGVKIIQRGRVKKDYFSAYFHWHNVLLTEENYTKTKDKRLALAYTGAYLALTFRMTNQHVDFKNKQTMELFDQVQIMNEEEMYRMFLRHQRYLHRFPPHIMVEYLLLKNSPISYSALKQTVKNIINSRYRRQIEMLS